MLFACNDDVAKDKKPSTNISNSKLPEAATKIIAEATAKNATKAAQLNAVNSLDSMGLFKEAIGCLDNLIHTDSLNYDYWLRRGQLCKYALDTPAALKAFKYAAKIYPTPLALMELANLFAETKNPLAVSISDQLIKMNPSGIYNAQAYLYTGIYYSRTGSNKKAFDFFEKCLAENNHLEDAYIERGYLLFELKRYEEALQNFVLLNKVTPTSADGYYWQAKCNAALGKKDLAIELYNKSLQLDPTIKEATEALKQLQ